MRPSSKEPQMPAEPSAQHRVEADSLGAVGRQAASLAKL